MATFDKHKTAGWRIRYFVDSERHDFYPGKKLTKRQASEVWGHISNLEDSVNLGVEVGAKTVDWTKSISEKKLNQLKKTGLIVTDEMTNRKKAWTFDQFIGFYEEKLKERKDASKKKWKTVFNHLRDCGFGEKLLSGITEYDATLFVSHLKKNGGAEYTIRRYSGFAKQLLGFAVADRVISINPFRELKTTATKPDESRKFEVTTESSLEILKACPDWEWSLIFGLMRWGGLRCPSELKIKWADVLWDKNRFCVYSPKTEHHEGLKFRWVPMFKELKPLFDEAFERAADGSEFVLGQRRHTGHKVLTDQYLKILNQAGVSAYPKLFTNLRATRATELVRAGLPAHLESKWFGHTEKVARVNYLQTNDADFDRWSDLVPNGTKEVPHSVPQTCADNL
jgi:integrase